MIKVLSPKTVEEVVVRERERKARTTLLMALPEDHLAKFHKMADAKEMWEAIKSRFCGNDKSKKMQKYLLKQQFEGFSVSTSNGLHKGNQDSRRRDVGYNGSKARDNGRRPAYQDDSKALVTIDGKDIDWSGHVKEDDQNYAMMAYSSINSGSDNEVKSCSKTCEESYARLKKLYDEQRDKLGDASVEITAYTLALKQTSVDESDSKPSEYASCESDSSVETTTSMSAPVKNIPKVICEPKVWTDASIIEEYELDCDDDSVSNVQYDKEKPSFAFTDSVKNVKTTRENVKEPGTPNHIPKVEMQDRNGPTRKGLGYAFTRKACFVCGSFSHLIRDCDFHEKRMAKQAELAKSKNKVIGQRVNRFTMSNTHQELASPEANGFCNEALAIPKQMAADLRLDDADGVECLPNEVIFAELARMGYEMPPPKMTFYKAFFSAQWKFLIHTIVQCMSAKRTA
nr:xylulose kinase-1 [Tanacetum cinerariifolium]